MSLVSVRMCANPDCRLPGNCQNMPAIPLAGIADTVDPGKVDETRMLQVFAQELALSPCSDDSGTLRLVPAGSEFTVHHGIPDPHSGRHVFMAVYDGPARTKDEWLAGSPEWGDEVMQSRWDEIKTAAAA